MTKEPIIKLFTDLFNGSPWIDVNIMDTLNVITAEKAAIKISGRNSIWEIVNHIINWRLNILQRLQGNVLNTPANNYFEPVTDQSETAWQATLQRLMAAHVQWIEFLKKTGPASFYKYPPKNITSYEYIHGILQHDAYHLGQIVLLSK